MRPLRYLLILSAVLFLSSCSTVSVDYEFDPGINTAVLKSYDWFPVPLKNVRYDLIIKEIMAEMEKQLEPRGFVKASGNPDFLISIHGSLQQFLTYEDYKYLQKNYEPYWARRRIDFSQYDSDTVIIDFINTETRSLFYRSTVTAFIMEPTAEKRREVVAEAVEEVLHNFQMIQSR